MINLSNQELENIILNAGADFVGFAKIEDQNIISPENLTTAISIGIVYKSSLSNLSTKETRECIENTKIKMAHILESTTKHLQKKGCKTWVPQISETTGDLSSVFSHKMAATMSGLGWIGKSSIFISNKFGCGSRLATIFTDATFKYGIPITKSLCGSCDKCVKACPCNAIKGADWHTGIERSELLDPWLCKKYRDSFKEKFGFSHPCCLCIKCCPR